MLFSKPAYPPYAVIALDKKGKEFWPLICAPGGLEGEQLIDQSILKIKIQLSLWMQSDLFYVISTDKDISHTLSHRIYQMPLAFLPTDEQIGFLYRLLQDTMSSASGTRFLDACRTATFLIPPEVFMCIRGRFLYSMTEGLSAQHPAYGAYPSKEAWVEVLKEIPWVPYLQFIQELYETDQTLIKQRNNHAAKLAALRASSQA